MTYYLVILGSEKEEINQIMKDRLLALGEVRKLMKNVYFLKIEGEEDQRMYVRDQIAGTEKYSVFVLTFRNDLYTAWTMPKDNSEYLKKVIREELHGTAN